MQAWQCQYEKPTVKALIGDLDPGISVMYKDLRQSVLKILGKKPKLEWMGLTWQWCETTTLDDASMLIAVHLVPDPLNARVALTLSTAFFESHRPAKLPKVLHSGLSSARTIGHQTWCEWPINSIETTDAIKEMIELAHAK